MRELVLDNERRREVSDALGMSFGRAQGAAAHRQGAQHHGRARHLSSVSMPPYMTIVVDDLERQGLVERKPHPTDRRAKLVETTARGKEAARRARVILNRPPAELTALPEAELAALLRGLRAIRPDPPASRARAVTGDLPGRESDSPTEEVTSAPTGRPAPAA